MYKSLYQKVGRSRSTLKEIKNKIKISYRIQMCVKYLKTTTKHREVKKTKQKKDAWRTRIHYQHPWFLLLFTWGSFPNLAGTLIWALHLYIHYLDNFMWIFHRYLKCNSQKLNLSFSPPNVSLLQNYLIKIIILSVAKDRNREVIPHFPLLLSSLPRHLIYYPIDLTHLLLSIPLSHNHMLGHQH